MSKIQIVTDSTAYFTKEEIAQKGLRVVPLNVTFSGETKDEGFPGEFEEYYNKLKTAHDFPTTSQPSIEAFASVYEEVIAQDKEIITIVISEKLSGTFNSASVAGGMVAADKISVVDSESTASNLKLLVNMAIEMADKGLSRSEIIEKLDIEKKKMSINLTAHTLDYLKKGGRLSGAQAAIGSLLNVKPIIALVDGKLESIGKVRGKSKALDLMMSKIPDNVEVIAICHILNDVEAQEFKGAIEKKFPQINVTIDELGPVIGSHLGPKAMGVCYKWS